MKALIVTPSSGSNAPASIAADVFQSRGFKTTCTSQRPDDRRWDVVVSWRPGGPYARPGGLTINPPDAVRLAKATQRAAYVMHTHGISVVPQLLPKYAVRPASPPKTSEMTRMRVHVGDLRVLAVDGEPPPPRLTRWREERLMETACRAVYVLGLHFGCVHVFVHKSGRWFISRVDPHPKVSEDLVRAYASNMAQMATTWFSDTSSAGEVVLGADPEFALFSREGRLLYASRYVQHRGVIGYDRQSRASRGSHYPLVEVRPNPSPSPLVVFTNIEHALQSARRFLPTRHTRWVAGSYPFGYYPTGGHIHFSGPFLTTPFLLALDTYLALPMMLLEHRARGRKRRAKYGHLGDFRRKNHGGFEYRTLSSWLVSPEATRAALVLAKVIAEEWRSLPSEPLNQARIAREFYRSKKARFRRLFPSWWQAITRTETALRYEYELSHIPDAIRQGAEWNDEQDFKRSWWS